MKKIFLGAMILGLSMNLISCAPSRTNSLDNFNYHEAAKPNLAAAAETNVQIGMLLLKQHHPEAAKENLLRAIRQAPKNPECWYAMAYYYEFTGNTELAAQNYKKALSVANVSNSGAARNNYGAFLCRQKHYKAGLAQILMAAQSPTYLNTSEAYENAGICAELIPDKKLAILYFQKALQNDPGRPNSLMSLSRIYASMGNKKLANYYKNKYAQLTAASN